MLKIWEIKYIEVEREKVKIKNGGFKKIKNK